MELGECIGILFLLAVIALIAIYGYHTHRCPMCGSYRTITRIESEWEPIDDSVDIVDVFLHVVTHGEKTTKHSLYRWVDQCRVCGFEIKGEKIINHF